MKIGNKVKLVDVSGLNGYEIMKQLKKGDVYTIAGIKKSGGLILEEIKHSYNMFGEIQGIKKERFEIVKNKKGK